MMRKTVYSDILPQFGVTSCLARRDILPWRGRNILPSQLALPHVKSAFATVSNSIPRKGVWVDSVGSDLSFPPLAKQQQPMTVAQTEADLT